MLRIINGRPLEPQVKQLMADFVSKTRGDLVTHEEISRSIGEKQASNRYASVVAAWKRQMLATRKVALKAVPGVGYQLLPASDQLQESIRRMTSGTRRIKDAVLLSEYTPEDELDDAGRTVRSRVLTSVSNLFEMAKREVKKNQIEFGRIRALPAVRPIA